MAPINVYRYYARLSSAVFVQVLLCYGGFWAGTKLDERFGTQPYLMFLCFVLGVSLGLWWVVRNANRTEEG